MPLLVELKSYQTLAQHTVITPDGLRGPNRMSGIEPGLAVCKGNALSAVLSLGHHRGYSFYD